MKFSSSVVIAIAGISLFFYSHVLHAETVEQLLASGEAPEGVVFEVVSGDEKLLNTLLPSIIEDINRLRQRYPDLSIAVVSHGREQFALMTKNSETSAQSHNLVKQLVSQYQVEVHVCGTYAGWKGYDDNDFPAYVDVAAAGPVQINDYVKLGYSVITLP